MSTTLTYCEKCGDIGFSFLWDFEKNGCFCCHSKGTTKFVPQEYLSCTGNTIEDALEEEFIIKFIKSSSNFDQDSWDKRIAFDEQRKYQDKIIEQNIEEQNNVPKCPTCQSANISKISTTSKVAGAAMFGLFSKTARSQFKCNNCGYKW